MAIYIQRQLNTECDQHKCEALPLQQLGKSELLGRRLIDNAQKVMVVNQTMSEDREKSFIYCEWASIENDLDSRQL